MLVTTGCKSETGIVSSGVEMGEVSQVQTESSHVNMNK